MFKNLIKPHQTFHICIEQDYTIYILVFVLSQTTCQACREGGQTVLKLCQILCESTGNTGRSSSRWRRRGRRTGRRRGRVEEQRGLKCVIITANYSRAYYTKYSQSLSFSLSLILSSPRSLAMQILPSLSHCLCVANLCKIYTNFAHKLQQIVRAFFICIFRFHVAFVMNLNLKPS